MNPADLMATRKQGQKPAGFIYVNFCRIGSLNTFLATDPLFTFSDDPVVMEFAGVNLRQVDYRIFHRLPVVVCWWHRFKDATYAAYEIYRHTPTELILWCLRDGRVVSV